MGALDIAPRGGLLESMAGARHPLILRNAEIERFEDAHRGVFDLWDGFFGRASKPTAAEVRDLVALGLVGGGMAAAPAAALVDGLGPDQSLRLYGIAQGLLGVAFMPDAAEDGGDPPGDASAAKKKTGPAAGG